jgi:hypothetical protein
MRSLSVVVLRLGAAAFIWTVLLASTAAAQSGLARPRTSHTPA